MQYYYDLKGGGFFCDEVHGENLPQDLVPISAEQHQQLLEALGSNKIIKQNKNGELQIIEPPKTAPIIGAQDVNYEKERRLKLPFSVFGVSFQVDEQSALKIVSQAAILGENDKISWISADNLVISYDAFEFKELAQLVSFHYQNIVLKARALKDMQPIPADYTDDKYWA